MKKLLLITLLALGAAQAMAGSPVHVLPISVTEADFLTECKSTGSTLTQCVNLWNAINDNSTPVNTLSPQACVESACNNLATRYNNLVAQYAPGESLLDCSNSTACSCSQQQTYATTINNLIAKYNLFNKYGVSGQALENC